MNGPASPLARTLTQRDRTLLRRWLLLIAAMLLWLTSAVSRVSADDAGNSAANDGPVIARVESQPYEQHGIVITPARSAKITINGLTYEEVYDSIPHHRADALVNPGYRHDATMEILFGELRPTTIVRNMPHTFQQPVYSRPYSSGLYPYGSYFRPYGWSGAYGLRAYRWSLWDNYLYRHSAFMFGVR
jgi:hypothetical protein